MQCNRLTSLSQILYRVSLACSRAVAPCGDKLKAAEGIPVQYTTQQYSTVPFSEGAGSGDYRLKEGLADVYACVTGWYRTRFCMLGVVVSVCACTLSGGGRTDRVQIALLHGIAPQRYPKRRSKHWGEMLLTLFNDQVMHRMPTYVDSSTTIYG